VNGYFYLPSLSPSCYANTYININTGLLGFCGEQYIVMTCQYKDITLASCIYSRWLDKLKQHKIDGYQKNIYQYMDKYLAEKYKKYFYSNYQCELAITEKNMLATINNQQGIKLRDELFIELNCPVFFVYQSYCGNTLLIKNPPLKPFDFQCVLGPEMAFQEIALYIGNFLTKRDNPLQITDNKVLCAAKGFDVKTSFRKSSSKFL
jgi:hypothetical protein